jgi:hypothetical protein
MLSRCRRSNRTIRMLWSLISKGLGKGDYAGMNWATHALLAHYGIGCF